MKMKIIVNRKEEDAGGWMTGRGSPQSRRRARGRQAGGVAGAASGGGAPWAAGAALCRSNRVFPGRAGCGRRAGQGERRQAGERAEMASRHHSRGAASVVVWARARCRVRGDGRARVDRGPLSSVAGPAGSLPGRAGRGRRGRPGRKTAGRGAAREWQAGATREEAPLPGPVRAGGLGLRCAGRHRRAGRAAVDGCRNGGRAACGQKKGRKPKLPP